MDLFFGGYVFVIMDGFCLEADGITDTVPFYFVLVSVAIAFRC